MKVGISIWMFRQGTGGLQKHAEQLAHELINKGHQVVIVTRSSTFVPQGRDYILKNEQDVKVCQDGLEVRHLIYPHISKPIQILISILCHRKVFLKLAVWLYIQQVKATSVRNFYDCDLIHHVGQSTALVGYAAYAASLRLDIPFFIQPTVHPNQFGHSDLDVKLFRLADHLLVHTQFEKEFFLKNLLSKQPISVIGNGISRRNDGNAERFRRSFDIHGPLVLYAGRKDFDKGYALVLKAWQQARTHIPNLVLFCIGPEGEVPRPSKTPNLFDLTYVDEQLKHDALAACDCLCVPSEGESFGLIFMEAAQYRKPIIARRLPVLVELLGNQSALLLGLEIEFNRVQLDADELAEGIVNLILDEKLAYQMGDNAFRASLKFTWDNIVSNFLLAYQEELYSDG